MPMPAVFILKVARGCFLLTRLEPDTPEEAKLREDAELGWCKPPPPRQDECSLDALPLGALLRHRGAVEYLLLSSSVYFPEDDGAPVGTDGLALVRAALRLARDPSYDLKVDSCVDCPYLVERAS